METLVHFAQAHETFRKPEIEAMAELAGFTIQLAEYSLNVHLSPLSEFLLFIYGIRLICGVVTICLDYARE